VKKSARLVPKLLSKEQKQERVSTYWDFIAFIQRHSMSMLENIVTMDETMVWYQTPKTKKQSKQWMQKGKAVPIKAWVQASHTKQMVMTSFDCWGHIYTHIVPGGPRSMPRTSWRPLHEAFQEEEAGDGGFSTGIMLWFTLTLYCRLDLPPTRSRSWIIRLFAGSGSGRLFLVPESEGGARWYPVKFVEPEERPGSGRPEYRRWEVRHCLQVLARSLQ
jgi:hypothetical protein